MKGFTVRPLTAQEEELLGNLRISELQRRFLPPRPLTERLFQRWGLWESEKLIGVVEVVGRPPTVWIATIQVDLNYQGLGYGTRGLAEVLKALRRRARIREVRAAVHMENTPARRLFQRLGFWPVGSPDPFGEEVFVLSLEDSTNLNTGVAAP
ncbi:MAG: GNAT family N-acetyltransferase [Bacteroidia bacterium]